MVQRVGGCPYVVYAAASSERTSASSRIPRAIIALILFAIVALAIVGFGVHLLFSPWLLLVAAGILLWIKLGPRRSRQ